MQYISERIDYFPPFLLMAPKPGFFFYIVNTSKQMFTKIEPNRMERSKVKNEAKWRAPSVAEAKTAGSQTTGESKMALIHDRRKHP